MAVIGQKKHDVTSGGSVEYFRGKKYLNRLISANLESFNIELEKSPIFALTGCINIARKEFTDLVAIRLLVDHCYGGVQLNVSEFVERCFFEVVEDPLMSHFISCIESYKISMGKDECSEWLIEQVRSLGGSNAAHLIMSMEVCKC